MTAPQCRWHLDSGRCPATAAAPGVPGVPELCPAHLTAIEPWARRRTAPGGTAEGWIDYMRRRADEGSQLRRALGEEPPMRRSPVSITAATHSTRTERTP